MTRLPQLEHDLVAAAGRRASPRRGRALVPAIAVAAMAAAVLALWPAAEPEREVPAPAAQEEGLPPGYQDAPPESGHRYERRPRLLAVGERAGERVFSVVGYHLGGPGREASLCLDVVHDGGASGCFSPSEHAQGTAGGMRTQSAVGATTQPVDAVEVTYEDAGRRGTVAAVLARAEAPEPLRYLGIEPFTMYLAEIPSGSRPRTAVATREGRVVWRAEFP